MQSLIAAHAPRPVVFALCGHIYHNCGFSTDPQQTSKSPPIRILSDYLESSVGNYSSWALFAIIPAVAVYFDVVGRTEVGIKMAAWGHVFLELGMGIAFWVCGNSLKRVVDESLKRNSARITASAGVVDTLDEKKQDNLVAVRKKATRMTFFIVQQVRGKDETDQCPMLLPGTQPPKRSSYVKLRPRMSSGIRMLLCVPCGIRLSLLLDQFNGCF